MTRWRGYRWTHPDWWLLPVAAAAWALLAVAAFTLPMHAHHHSAFAPALAWWGLMAVAMMLPLARVDARWLAHRSLGRRRGRTVVLHVAGFLAVWAALGAATVFTFAALSAGAGAGAGALAVAAAWHVTPARRRVFLRCRCGRAPAIRGIRATTDCVAAGARTASRCLATCGPAMVAMAAAHSVPLMAALWVVGASERRHAPNADRRAGRPVEAAALAMVALAVASRVPGL